MVDAKRRISLVLGSGGARGHAHIGVIRALNERGMVASNVAGSSMGAVVGGMLVAGELDAYYDWVRELRQRDVIRLLDFSFSMTSLFKGDRIIGVLKDLIGDRKIEELETGFTAVATSLDDQREIWLNRGSLFTAIRASTAVPTIFSPVRINGRLLVDGGLINPVPIAPTLNDATELTVAVSLSGSSARRAAQKREDKPKMQEAKEQGPQTAIASFIHNLVSKETTEETVQNPGAADLITQSLDVMQSTIARFKLAAYRPDVLIEIPRDACTFFEFDRAEEMVELGYEIACKVLDRETLR